MQNNRIAIKGHHIYCSRNNQRKLASYLNININPNPELAEIALISLYFIHDLINIQKKKAQFDLLFEVNRKMRLDMVGVS